MVKITFPDGSVRDYEQGVLVIRLQRVFLRLLLATLYLARLMEKPVN